MLQIIEADLNDPTHANALVQLLDEYARDPMGGGKGLSAYVKANIVAELRKRPTARVILAVANETPVGLTICFEGFSTFACQPLLNIHDIVVTQAHRGKGISRMMMEKAEEIARRLGCCKLTLEVLEGNHKAQAAYRALGYAGYELDPSVGKALFWQKKLA